ncbi:hypothetical protein KZO85_12620 [Chromohalobacter canadensis]|uniref:hypothetical protein n=1 Tax=Chromohalobacter canadensis TaxID=141389 RepID=UPI0021BED124|nr:hypothetical protein [Chromohalobacter canadensis]MCT8469429.1 hypothetical protein [Chromohalobacter canadensis]MCT8472053.1 hypothetical protein [Chromohalobacter canadensis]MCT8499834.1 hypothetical protein [Chromohalobacter canadensis]
MNIDDNSPRPAVSRSPRGCTAQVMVQVTPLEREKLEAIAELEMRSLSSTARMLLIKGIEQYNAETEHAARC